MCGGAGAGTGNAYDNDDERAPRSEQRDTPPRGGRPLVADAAAKETAPIFFLNWNHVIPAVYLLFRNRINGTRARIRIYQTPVYRYRDGHCCSRYRVVAVVAAAEKTKRRERPIGRVKMRKKKKKQF